MLDWAVLSAAWPWPVALAAAAVAASFTTLRENLADIAVAFYLALALSAAVPEEYAAASPWVLPGVFALSWFLVASFRDGFYWGRDNWRGGRFSWRFAVFAFFVFGAFLSASAGFAAEFGAVGKIVSLEFRYLFLDERMSFLWLAAPPLAAVILRK